MQVMNENKDDYAVYMVGLKECLNHQLLTILEQRIQLKE